jgi:chromosome segregation ATPase
VTTYYPIENPLTALVRRIVGDPPPAGPDYSNQLTELKRAVTELQGTAQDLRIEAEADRRAALEREQTLQDKLTAQDIVLRRQADLINQLRTSEQKLLGDQREHLTRITSLEFQLHTEREARTAQASEAGFMKAQLETADGRLKHQNDQITAQGNKIAVLEDERAKYQGLYAGEALAKTAIEQDLAAARQEIAALRVQITDLEAQLKRAKILIDEGGAG